MRSCSYHTERRVQGPTHSRHEDFRCNLHLLRSQVAAPSASVFDTLHITNRFNKHPSNILAHDSKATYELQHIQQVQKKNHIPEVFTTVMQNATKRIILITGCDSGFGALSAIALSSSGYRVVAACLTEDGAERLRSEVALAAVCDVTKEKDISRLTSIIAKLASDENLYLWAVINNAGVAPIGYMEWISMESVRKAMDVNYFGMISIIKAMLPLLKKTKGSRIINISSSAGFGGGAALGAYAGMSSKGYSAIFDRACGHYRKPE